jgi:hypothetical protein
MELAAQLAAAGAALEESQGWQGAINALRQTSSNPSPWGGLGRLRLLWATTVAFVAHRRQKRKQGSPYIGHLLCVCGEALAMSWTAAIVGVLHDIIEDQNFTVLSLSMIGFPLEAQLVSGLSAVDADEYLELINAIAKKAALLPIWWLVVLVSYIDKDNNLDGYVRENDRRFALGLPLLWKGANPEKGDPGHAWRHLLLILIYERCPLVPAQKIRKMRSSVAHLEALRLEVERANEN